MTFVAEKKTVHLHPILEKMPYPTVRAAASAAFTIAGTWGFHSQSITGPFFETSRTAPVQTRVEALLAGPFLAAGSRRHYTHVNMTWMRAQHAAAFPRP